tara:strand:- start:1604 stop:1849 length:246 start_codon:yes stop_codon:yes gene_type:complete
LLGHLYSKDFTIIYSKIVKMNQGWFSLTKRMKESFVLWFENFVSLIMFQASCNKEHQDLFRYQELLKIQLSVILLNLGLFK